jgi:hypothetical protein
MPEVRETGNLGVLPLPELWFSTHPLGSLGSSQVDCIPIEE